MEHLINKITPGDARELAKAIPDNSIDLIFCDPVYENIEDYRWLAELAMRVSKLDSAVLVWCSKNQLAKCQIAMEAEGLSFQTILFYTVVAKQTRPLFLYGIMNWTTPCLVFAKGVYKCRPFLVDTIRDSKPAQNGFVWNKNTGVIDSWMQAFSKQGALVFDPFAGSGTVPVVAKQTGRNFIGFEINQERAIEAQYRVDTTPMPLFLLDETETQSSMNEMVG